jgi:hypothetical protein
LRIGYPPGTPYGLSTARADAEHVVLHAAAQAIRSASLSDARVALRAARVPHERTGTTSIGAPNCSAVLATTVASRAAASACEPALWLVTKISPSGSRVLAGSEFEHNGMRYVATVGVLFQRRPS